jgi:protein-S-isoprenylcysteine O-methyltransferase Ste14
VKRFMKYDARRRRAHERPSWYLIGVQALTILAVLASYILVMGLSRWLVPEAFTGTTDITALVIGLTVMAALWRLGNASLDELTERAMNRRDGV